MNTWFFRACTRALRSLHSCWRTDRMVSKGVLNPLKLWLLKFPRSFSKSLKASRGPPTVQIHRRFCAPASFQAWVSAAPYSLCLGTALSPYRCFSHLLLPASFMPTCSWSCISPINQTTVQCSGCINSGVRAPQAQCDTLESNTRIRSQLRLFPRQIPSSPNLSADFLRLQRIPKTMHTFLFIAICFKVYVFLFFSI